jgi:RHS repeat-associated protein
VRHPPNLSSLALPSSYSTSCGHETPFSYSVGNSNQLPSSSGFTYDAAGNLMASGTGNYVYNAEHQMTSATVGSLTTTYSYDGDGKRVEKSGGKIYWYGGEAEALDETDLSGNTNNSTFSEYVRFDGQRMARRDYLNNVFYYFSDHLNTSRQILQAGQTSPCYDADFYAYGGEITHTNTCTQNYKFTGKERDIETGFDYFGARYYSNGLGRFMSPDWAAKAMVVPYAEFADPQSLNLYSYVRNVPTTRYDADGHCAGDDCGRITVTAAVSKQPEALKSETKNGRSTATAEGQVRYTIKYGGKPMKDTPVHEDVTNKDSRDGQPMQRGKGETVTRDNSTNNQGVIADQTTFSITVPALGAAGTNMAESIMSTSVFEKDTTQVLTFNSPSGSACSVTETRKMTNTDEDGQASADYKITLTSPKTQTATPVPPSTTPTPQKPD